MFDKEVSDLIVRIYEGASDRTLLPKAIETIADFSGSFGGHLCYLDCINSTIGLSICGRLHDDGEREYREYYGNLDPRCRYSRSTEPGLFIVYERLFSNDFINKSEFYQDFIFRHGMGECLGGSLIKDDKYLVVFAILRSQKQGAFDSESIERFNLLKPHLQQAVRLQRRLLSVEETCEAGSTVIDCLPIAVALVSESGRVILMNARMESLIAENDGIALIGGKLSAASHAEATELRRLIHESARGVGSGNGYIRLSRPSLKDPLVAHVVRTPPRVSGKLGADTAAAAVFVADPRRSPRVLPEMLIKVFGLTRAEARLAEALAKDARLTDLAEQWNLSVETLRRQIKSIFAKTDVHRQSELIKVLYNIGSLGLDGESTVPASTAKPKDSDVIRPPFQRALRPD